MSTEQEGHDKTQAINNIRASIASSTATGIAITCIMQWRQFYTLSSHNHGIWCLCFQILRHTAPAAWPHGHHCLSTADRSNMGGVHLHFAAASRLSGSHRAHATQRWRHTRVSRELAHASVTTVFRRHEFHHAVPVPWHHHNVLLCESKSSQYRWHCMFWMSA